MHKWGSLCPPPAAEYWSRNWGWKHSLWGSAPNPFLYLPAYGDWQSIWYLGASSLRAWLVAIFVSDCTCFAIYFSVLSPAHVLLSCWQRTSSERIYSTLSFPPPLPKPSNKPIWVLPSRTREPNPSLFKAALDISWLFQRISYSSDERCLSWQRCSLPSAGVGSAAASEGVRTAKEFFFCPWALRSPSQTIPGWTGKSGPVSAYQPPWALLLLLINPEAAGACRAHSEFQQLQKSFRFSLLNLLHLIYKWRQDRISVYKCKYVNGAAAGEDGRDPRFTPKDAAEI